MANIRVPSFLVKLDSEQKKEMMELLRYWKTGQLVEHLVSHLEEELDRLIQEDEKDTFVSWFQTRWSKAKRLGRREQIRQLLKDLQ